MTLPNLMITNNISFDSHLTESEGKIYANNASSYYYIGWFKELFLFNNITSNVPVILSK